MTKLNISGLISKQATKQAKLHSFLVENQLIILLVFFLQLVTIGIAVFSGYNFFVAKFENLLEINKAVIITVSVLFVLIIEILTALFLLKTFKFLYKGLVINAIAYFIGVLLFYSLSFYVATNGLASYTIKRFDNSEVIKAKYQTNKDLLIQSFESSQAEINQAIETINNNPLLWKNGKLSNLSTEQINSVNNYYNQLSGLRNQLKSDLQAVENSEVNELKSNTNNATSEAEKYYIIVMVIMFIQFICNALMAFFYHKIYNENNSKDVINDSIKLFTSQISNNTTSIIEQTINERYNAYLVALNNHLAHTTITTTGTTTTTGTNKKPIGFDINNDNRINENRNNDTIKTGSTVTFDHNIRLCLHCNKPYVYKHHKQIYCSTDCRVQSNVNKSGKTLIINGIKYKPNNK